MDDQKVSGEIYADKDEIKGWSIQPPTPAEECERALVATLYALRGHKPNDRSEKDRYYAVTITDLEKALAYFKTFVLDMED